MDQTKAQETNFESPDLRDLAFLAFKGHRPTPSIRRGSLIFFTVPLPAGAAERLLASPERELFARYFEEWLQLRRVVDRMRDGGGVRR